MLQLRLLVVKIPSSNWHKYRISRVRFYCVQPVWDMSWNRFFPIKSIPVDISLIFSCHVQHYIVNVLDFWKIKRINQTYVKYTTWIQTINFLSVSTEMRFSDWSQFHCKFCMALLFKRSAAFRIENSQLTVNSSIKYCRNNVKSRPILTDSLMCVCGQCTTN